MKHRFTLERAINVIRITTIPMASFPLPPDASTKQIFLRNFGWLFSFTNMLTALAATCNNIYQNLHDLHLVMRCLSEISAMVLVAIKMLVWKIDAARLEGLIADLQKFLTLATAEETAVIQFYVDKCLYLHGYIFTCALIGPTIFIVGPLLLKHQPLPGETLYPFSIEPLWIWITLYCSQTVMTLQVGCMAILDFMFSILLWFAGARFEMISNELNRATTSEQVTRCIQKHQESIKFADRLRASTRVNVAIMTAALMFVVTIGGVVIVSSPPIYVLVKFTFLEIVGGLMLFIIAWPANNLIEMSERVGDAAFGCAWIGKSSKMQKDLTIMMQRSGIPMVIAVDGVLPGLTLEFYGSAMSASFSYLVTLRAFMADD